MAGVWPESRSIAAAIDYFLEVYCRGRGLSNQTIRDSYGSPLRRVFLPWCLANNLKVVADLTPEAVERFAAALQERHTAKGDLIRQPTVRAYSKAVQQFLSWAGLAAKRMPLPRLKRQPRDTLTPAEVDRLEDAARIERDKLIVRVMGDTGAREGEIANLRVADVQVRSGRYHFLRLRGKTGERMVPIEAGLYRRLVAYGEGKTGRPRTRHPHLFMAHRKRNQGDYEPLTPDGIYQALKDAADRADLGKRVYPHLLRHSAITRFVASGMNAVTVSELMGVSVAVIAQHYSHQTPEQHWEAMMRVVAQK